MRTSCSAASTPISARLSVVVTCGNASSLSASERRAITDDRDSPSRSRAYCVSVA
jgi:hypothetical protein